MNIKFCRVNTGTINEDAVAQSTLCLTYSLLNALIGTHTVQLNQSQMKENDFCRRYPPSTSPCLEDLKRLENAETFALM